jgi:hypothetical protein
MTHYRLMAITAVIAAFLLAPAGAQALTLGRAGPVIRADEARVRAGLERYPVHWRGLARALSREATDLRAVRAGGDVERGLTLIASSYETLARDVLRARGGRVPAGEVASVRRMDRRGRRLLLHARAAGWRGNRHG